MRLVVKLTSTLILAACIAMSALTPVCAGTFDVTYTADRYHAADNHTHESADGWATRSELGMIGFQHYNPDGIDGGWTQMGGWYSTLTAGFESDCWGAQYNSGTADGLTSWHYFKCNFGDSYLIKPAGGHSTLACDTFIDP